MVFIFIGICLYLNISILMVFPSKVIPCICDTHGSGFGIVGAAAQSGMATVASGRHLHCGVLPSL